MRAVVKRVLRLLPPPPAKYKAALLGGVVFLVVFALGAIYGERGLMDLWRLEAELQRWEELAFQQQQANARLRVHVERLNADDRYLERWAREHLHWAKPGEIIYRVPDAAR
jgi:cell division protein FtsB